VHVPATCITLHTPETELGKATGILSVEFKMQNPFRVNMPLAGWSAGAAFTCRSISAQLADARKVFSNGAVA
jgi:peptidase E